MTEGIWIPHCPLCGKFVSNVIAWTKGERIETVEGKCKKHGDVDITDQDWEGDNFEYNGKGGNDERRIYLR